MIFRVLILLIATLMVGLIINQFHPNGIRWALLSPDFSHTTNSVEFINLPDAFSLIIDGQAIAIDVRETDAFEIDHLPGAISMPWQQFIRSPEIISQLDNEMTYIIYCFDPDCYEAKTFAGLLQKNGFRKTKVLYDGFSGWLEMGLPIEP